LVEDQAWAIRMAVKIFRKRMPLKLCDKKMKSSDFIVGTEIFNTSISFGTDNKGMNSQLTPDRIKKSLAKFITSKQYPNPLILIQVRYTDDPNNDNYHEELINNAIHQDDNNNIDANNNFSIVEPVSITQNHNNINNNRHNRDNSISQFSPGSMVASSPTANPTHSRNRSSLSYNSSNNANIFSSTVVTKLGKPLLNFTVTPQQLLDSMLSQLPIQLAHS
jgi:hypothetical protein